MSGLASTDTAMALDASVELSVLIVSFGTRERTLACIRSVLDQTRSKPFEVVVVDNSSQDGSAAAIGRDFPDVQLVPLDRNLGYARAMNLAAKRSRGRYLILLNPDTLVTDGALDRLLAFARSHPGHGLYGGRTLRPDGEVDPRSCWGPPTVWSLTCFGLGLSTAFPSSILFNPESLGRWRRDSVREVPVLSGSLCLVTRPVWEELGGFDPVYFMYGEDVDLGLRASRRGYRPLFTPEAAVVHEVGASSATDVDKSMLLMRGKATLVRRRWTGLWRAWALAMLSAGACLRAALTRVGLARREVPWPVLWARRQEWMIGYVDAEPESRRQSESLPD